MFMTGAEDATDSALHIAQTPVVETTQEGQEEHRGACHRQQAVMTTFLGSPVYTRLLVTSTPKAAVFSFILFHEHIGLGDSLRCGDRQET